MPRRNAYLLQLQVILAKVILARDVSGWGKCARTLWHVGGLRRAGSRELHTCLCFRLHVDLFRYRRQLEDKVDSLVELLAQAQSENHETRGTTSLQSTGRSAAGVEAGVHSSVSDRGIPPEHDVTSCYSQSSGQEVADCADYSLLAMPSETTDKLFSKYSKQFAPCFPFVTFPSSETASTMRVNRSMTLQALLSVSLYQEPDIQQRAAESVAHNIKRKMMSRSHYSFDLLQSILLHLCWYHYRFRNRHQEFYLMIQYAITLCHELGIDRSPGEKRSDLPIRALEESTMEGSRTEQWRALLGTYQQAAV